jgi:3-hydroxyisobutyrate dehydrogenase-like beta-hydroxyacid dehydrogenase
MQRSGADVAVIGAGRMGLPVSRRLHDAGCRVTVFDSDPTRRDAAAAAGLMVAASAADAVAGAELHLTVLPGSAALAALMGGDGGLLTALPAGTTWIDLTSTSPAVARELAEAAARRDVAALDAPMGGGPAAAATGELTLYIGGDTSVVQRWASTLEFIATTAHHLGGSGTGCLVKLLVNLLWFGQAALSAEAALLAAASGVDARRLVDVLHSGPATSAFLEHDFPQALVGDYLATFELDRIVEELDAVTAEAADRALPSQMMDSVAHAHRRALGDLGPVSGELAVVAHLERIAGIDLGEAPGARPRRRV